jgi:hypothetical protein
MIQSGATKSTLEMRGVAVVIGCVLAALAAFTAVTAPLLLPRYFFLHQDIVVLAALIALLAVAAVPRSQASAAPTGQVRLTTRSVLVGAAVAAALLWAGTYVLFHNYPLSRDEQMAVFDMQVFRSGRLAAPLPPQWRHYAEALTPAFLLPLPGNAAWVSSYMPGNAMLRTVFGLIDPALMNPLLAAAGGVATFDCARRLFPGNLGAQAVALLMYATSAQVLVTAMTPYAMTAHLALNMIWLALYLRDTRPAHAAAIAIGFVAIGLHQVIFHPLFALPFIEELRRRGRWRTAICYLAAYALFGLFWISYPQLVAVAAGLKPQSGAGTGIGGFVADRVVPVLLDREPAALPLMAANLLRFVSWQNLALLPLMAFALPAVRRQEGIARPLLGGVVLTIAAMTLLLPYQGHGWGYRYLHGLIGNCALLAAYGWRDHGDRSEVRSFVRAATAVTMLASLPFLVWRAQAFIDPYARVNRMIDRINADMVVVDSEGPDFRVDEVTNRPDLTNRPLRLAGHLLRPLDIGVLCGRGTIAFVSASDMHALGVGVDGERSSPHFHELREAAGGSCRR